MHKANLYEALFMFHSFQVFQLKMSFMFTKTLFFIFLFIKLATSNDDDSFIFNGFIDSNLILDGSASITSDGVLALTNGIQHRKGHAFRPIPLNFKSAAGKPLSFSTNFVFSIHSDVYSLSGNGFAFLISPITNLYTALPSQYLGLFDNNNNGNSSNHLLAVDFDTMQNPEFREINDNFVGIDINSLSPIMSSTAGYYNDSTGMFTNLTLTSGQPMQVWIDFNGEDMKLDVSLSPIQMPKPKRPLMSLNTFNLSSVMLNSMYVGFSSATGVIQSYHNIHGWSFRMNGVAEPLDYTKLPSIFHFETKVHSHVLKISLPIVSCLCVLLIVAATVFIIRRRMKYAEVLEDWELEYGPHRFLYEDLYQATKGFKEKELLGAGGFGRVYRGLLPSSQMEVAVKKVSHSSSQGMKQFVAEIVTIGRLRHRNLVHLLGYCRRKRELLLVYEYMPNGSLDRYLYDPRNPTLNWAQRFRIIKGVASGLLYLHEDWEQVVIHRDIKASNVLLDSEMNGRLGDFGLAKLYDHEADPQTTHVAGTMGYIAPELARTGKASTATDMFAFGIFLLEVACGRRPIKSNAEGEEMILMDWVLVNWQRGLVLETRDSRLGEDYRADEVELVLKLGLLCTNPTPSARPSMRQVLQFLEGDVALPELPPSYFSFNTLSPFQNEGFDGYGIKSFSSSVVSISGISGGR